MEDEIRGFARRCIATSFVSHSNVSARFGPSRRESNDRDHKATFVASVIARSGVRHGGKRENALCSSIANGFAGALAGRSEIKTPISIAILLAKSPYSLRG